MKTYALLVVGSEGNRKSSQEKQNPAGGPRADPTGSRYSHSSCRGTDCKEPSLDGDSSDLVGLPDFLIRDGDGYIIRDSKLARRVEGRHPEIALQLQLYGWLYEQVVSMPPLGLQVHSVQATSSTCHTRSRPDPLELH